MLNELHSVIHNSIALTTYLVIGTVLMMHQFLNLEKFMEVTRSTLRQKEEDLDNYPRLKKYTESKLYLVVEATSTVLLWPLTYFPYVLGVKKQRSSKES